jgi:hypothetical protein
VLHVALLCLDLICSVGLGSYLTVSTCCLNEWISRRNYCPAICLPYAKYSDSLQAYVQALPSVEQASSCIVKLRVLLPTDA